MSAEPLSDESGPNPLLARAPLPQFTVIKPEHVEPAVRAMLAEQRRALEAAERTTAPDLDWLRSLERINVDIHRVWGPVSHLNSVVSSPALRDAFNRCLPLVTEFGTELGQNEALYRHFGTLATQVDRDRPVEKQLIAHALRDFRLGGVTLQGAARQRFREVMQLLAARQASFEQNLMDATDAFQHREADRAALAGLPEIVLERAKALAAERGVEGFVLTLDPPTYQAIMTHAESAALRQRYYEAWVTRASDQGPHAGRWNNGPLIEEILALRHETAQLVGFKTYAELSLATKMADSPERVIEFLRDLARRSKPVAAAELAALSAYAGRELDPWDVGFYAERWKQEQLNLAVEELRPYFPLPRVVEGLFKLTGQLFDLTIVEAATPSTWHPSVRYFELKNRDGTAVGSFFVDLFARPNKRGGAWMDVCRSRAKLNGVRQLPVAYLVCNFNPPVADTPSLLTHSEAVTLFHEFGHTLHHLLTEVDYPSLAGVNGVAWDAVELPSQFMENFGWNRQALDLFAKHYETGEKLPHELFERMLAARHFHAGLFLVRQLEFALFDFLLHLEYDPAAGARPLAVLEQVRKEVAVLHPPAWQRFPHAFSHIFAGGYAAGYYSYLWAELLSADAFGEFEERAGEAGEVIDRATGERFRKEFLAVGASRPALESFIAFRGRKPEPEALLRSHGLA
jgi:oligopeptidase A